VDSETGTRHSGAPPIDLIDGDRLCDLLKNNGIGVTTTERVVEDVKVEADYFTSLEPKR
jgi:restriction system protein